MPQRRLERWLETELGLRNASADARLGGGNSNVTQLIRHDGGLAVLRRPPDDTISASAGAGIAREYGMLEALHGRAKVPRPLGYCDDLTVAGHVFSVIEHVPGVAKIGRMAVLRAMRGTQIGRQVLHALMVEAKRQGYREVLLHAQLSAENFYLRAGFQRRGQPFEEAGIGHVEMVRAL